MTIVVGYQ